MLTANVKLKKINLLINSYLISAMEVLLIWCNVIFFIVSTSLFCCEGNVVPSTFASEFDTRKALYRIDPC